MHLLFSSQERSELVTYTDDIATWFTATCKLVSVMISSHAAAVFHHGMHNTNSQTAVTLRVKGDGGEIGLDKVEGSNSVWAKYNKAVPSLISLTVSVEVKHHVYSLTYNKQ